MKLDLLDNGQDAVLANALVWLRHSPTRSEDTEMYIRRVGQVIRRAEMLMPGIGFAQCAEEIEEVVIL